MIFLTDKDEKVFEEKYSLEDKAYSIYDLHIIIWIKFILNCMLYLCMTTQPPESFLLIINKIFSNKYLTTTLLKVHESRSDWTKTFYNTYVNFHFFFFFVYLHLIYIIFVTEIFYDTRVCFMFEWNTLSGFGQDIIIVRKKTAWQFLFMKCRFS